MPYLPLTLKAVAEQSYTSHKIIVWDNGSTDGTLEELRRWIPSHIPGQVICGKPMAAVTPLLIPKSAALPVLAALKMMWIRLKPRRASFTRDGLTVQMSFRVSN